jgi:hypothetical protein
MIASTLLAVVFVPSFFVVMQKLDKWRKKRQRPPRPLRSRPTSIK